jgi:hypothetical protein
MHLGNDTVGWEVDLAAACAARRQAWLISATLVARL